MGSGIPNIRYIIKNIRANTSVNNLKDKYEKRYTYVMDKLLCVGIQLNAEACSKNDDCGYNADHEDIIAHAQQLELSA